MLTIDQQEECQCSWPADHFYSEDGDKKDAA